MWNPQELPAVAGSAVVAALCFAALILWAAPPSLYRRATATMVQAGRVVYNSRSRCRSSQLMVANVPVLGMLPSLLLHLQRFYEWSDEVLAASGGSFRFRGPWLARMGTYVTCEPRNVEHALGDRRSGTNFRKAQAFASAFRDVLGDHGIFLLDSHLPEWRLQRKLASLHVNSRPYRAHMETAVLDAVTHKLLPLLGAMHQQLSTGQRGAIDLQDILLRYSLHTVCSTAFDLDSASLDASLPAVPFALALEKAMEITTRRWCMPSAWWKALRWLKLGKERELPAAVEVLDAFAMRLISDRRRKLAQSNEQFCCRDDMLSCFMKAEDMLLQAADDNTEEHCSDKVLRDMVISFLFAGRDGAGLGLSWFFWLLASHPEEEEKILAEVLRVLQLNPADGQDLMITDQLTAAKLQEMVYLHAALAETLRLYPPLPFNARDVINDDTLPNGHCVRRGDRLLLSVYSMGRMESIWGPDAASFRPQRWLQVDTNATGERLVTPSPFEYSAFGAGPRSCVGKSTAFFVMKAAAAAIIVHFKVLLLPSHQVSPKLSLALHMKDGLLATLQRRTFAK